MSSANVLIPAKFISIILHFIFSACIVANYRDNILSSNILESDSSNWSTAKNSILAAAWLSLIFLFIEIVFLFVGINTHSDRLNIIQTIAHSVGIVLYVWFTLDTWYYDQLWAPWFFFSFCPLVIECYSGVSNNLYYKKFKA